MDAKIRKKTDNSVLLQTGVKSVTRPISDGPNRDRLFDALKYAYDDRHARIPVEFKIRMSQYDGSEMRVSNFRIFCLEHENDSGHSFNLSGDGYASPNRTDKRAVMLYCRWRAYYNASVRKGTITISWF